MGKKLTALFITISVFISPIYSQAMAAKDTQSIFQKLKASGYSVIERAKENPYYAASITAASLLAGYIGWTLVRRNINPAGAAIAPLLAAAPPQNQPHPAPRHPHHRIHQMTPEQMLQEALDQSSKVQSQLDVLQMGPADLAFQQDIFCAIRGLPTHEERLRTLQATLYDHDQVFVARQRLHDFAIMMQELPMDRMVEEFARITQHGWSILALVRGLEVLDIDAHPQMLVFHSLRQLLLDLRAQVHASPLDSANKVLERLLGERPLHRFDALLLRLAERYFLAIRGDCPNHASNLTIEEEACMKLLLEELLGEVFVEVQRPAIEQMSPVLPIDEPEEAGSVLRPVDDEERRQWEKESEAQRQERVRKARLNRLDKKE